MPYQEKPELTEEDKVRLERDFGKLYRESSRGGESGRRTGKPREQIKPVEAVPPEGSNPSPCINGSTSDGFHTLDELYEHRHTLWIALCKAWWNTTHDPHSYYVWRSRLHSDGTGYPGWFVLGVFSKPVGQVTYHLPDSKWDACEFAKTLEKCPEYDGHTSADVLERIAKL